VGGPGRRRVHAAAPAVDRANLYSMIGTLALAISMTAATLMVVDYLFPDPTV
jgi:hypothetical protein